MQVSGSNRQKTLPGWDLGAVVARPVWEALLNGIPYCWGDGGAAGSNERVHAEREGGRWPPGQEPASLGSRAALPPLNP